MNKYIKSLRKFLIDNRADAILINSADEFLSEYNILSLNSRYKVTNFSGSVGDCIVTKNKVYQIVDGRYYQQVDQEVDHDVVSVIKMKQGGSPIKEIAEALSKKQTLIVPANKFSVNFCENLALECGKKDIILKYINYDPLDDVSQNTYTNVPLSIVDKSLAGKTIEDKFKYFSSRIQFDDVILVTIPVNFAYLTNLRNYDFPYSSAPRGKAVITNKSLILFTDSEIPYEYNWLKVKSLSDFREYLSTLEHKNVLVDTKTFTRADYMQINSSNRINQTNIFDVKSRKTSAEIQHLQSAFTRTDNVLRKANMLINSEKKLTEYDLYCAILEFFEQEGAIAPSFKPIVASGSNSSIIHYKVPSKTKFINDGDLVMIDCGGFFEAGLATDVTRTFIKGEPSEEQKYIYTKVFQAFFSAYARKYRSTATWRRVDFRARDFLKSEEKNGWYFSHSTGHGIGISVHETPPTCAPFTAYEKLFKRNYVFSIEPGLYKQGVGGVRLENAVYIKDINKNLEIEALSHYPFEEKLIDKNMLTKKELKFLEEWQNHGKNNNITI